MGGWRRCDVPSVLRTSQDHVAVVPLAEDTIAQVVSLLDGDETTVIQVSDAVPAGLRAAVVRHVATARHQHECCYRGCEQARAWLREIRRVRPLRPVVSAS